ncbi:hypothetical protein KBI23_20135 [bacterium]|nr:hypothetical protein [bacterium]MBP9806672.1 hypothetical protein [bacterium]
MQQAKLSLFASSALAAIFSCLLQPLAGHCCPEHGDSKSTTKSTDTKSIDSKTLAKDSDTSSGKSREGFNQPLILSGLKQMKLVIGELDQFSIDHGINKEKIRHLMVDELVPTHVTICGDDNCCAGASGKSNSKSHDCETSNTPILYLKLKTVADSANANTATFSINMALVEKVKVARNKQELMVAVWSKDAAGSSQSNMQAQVDSQLKEVVKHFRRDFALANSADIGHGKKHPLKKDDHSSMPDGQE